MSSDDEDCSLGHPVVGVVLMGESDVVFGVDSGEGVSVPGLILEDVPDRVVDCEGSEELVGALLKTKGSSLSAPPGRSESIEPGMVPGSAGVLANSEDVLFS